jgi:phosphoadenosine phosphosulfate reductase
MTRFIQPLTQPATLDLKKLNQKFEKAHPKDILAWCVVNIPTGLVQASTFSVDDMVITDLLYRDLCTDIPVPVMFLNTLHHFSETLEFVAACQAIYQIDLRIYQPLEAKDRKSFAKKFGKDLWKTDLAKFHQLTKQEPMQRGLQELGAIAWLTGRRRDQSQAWARMPIFELDPQQRLKVNPLANWTRKESWAYVFEHDVVYNPLHDQGYPNIGDEPLTIPMREGEDTSTGSWQGSDVTECGLHF